MAQSYTRRINIWINGKEVKNQVYDIKNAINKLTNEQARMTMGSKEYIAHTQKIKYLKGIIQQHNDDLKGTAAGWAKIKNLAHAMNNYFLLVSSFVAGFTGTILAGKKAITTFAEFDDKVADVMKTTQQTKEEVLGMNENFKKLDTRTAQDELMNLAKISGKLGYELPEEVEDFVEASDKIKVALQEDLKGNTEEAIGSIGKLVDLFHVKEKFGIEESMLKVGSAINILGASGTAQEGNIVDFTNRLGGIAPQAKISIANIMGLGATVDQLGQHIETAGTAISQVITGMFEDPATYAKIAGMEVKKFTALLNQDANAAFIKFLSGLQSNKGGLTELTQKFNVLGIDGSRAIQVIGALSNNVEMLQQAQRLSNIEFNKGTSIINEFNTKNSSAQAKLEKNRKVLYNMTVDLGEKLLPVLTASTSGFSYFVKYVGIATDFSIKHSRAILTAAAGIATYVVVLKGVHVIETMRNMTIQKGLVLSNLQAIAIRTQIMLTGQATMAQKRALVVTRALNTAMKTNIWGLVISGIVMAGFALNNWLKKATEAVKVEKEHQEAREKTAKAVDAEKTEIDRLVKVAKDEHRSKGERLKALNELKRVSNGYLEGLTLENLKTAEGTTLLKKYNRELEDSIWLKGNQEEMESITNRQREIQRKRFGIAESGGTSQEAQQAKEMRDKYDNVAGRAVDARTETSLFEKFDRIYQAALTKDNELLAEYNALSGMQIKLEQEKARLTMKRIKAGYTPTPAGNEDPTINPFGYDPEFAATQWAALNKQIGELEEKLKDEIFRNDPAAQKTRETLEGLKAKAKEVTDLVESLQHETEVEIQDESEKYFMDGLDKEVDALIENAEKELEIFKETEEKKLEAQKEFLDRRQDLEKEYQDRKKALENEAISTSARLFQIAAEVQADHEIKILDEKYQKEADKLSDQLNNKLISQAAYDAKSKQLEEKRAADELKIRKKQANIEKMIASLEIGVEAAKTIFEIKAKAAAYLAGGVTAPLAALALSQIPLVLASAALQTGLVWAQPDPYYEGGFTGPGGKHEVAGLVHKKEYVVPEEGVENPDLNRILNLVELYRQQKRLPMLRTQTILDSISSTGLMKGGYTSSSTGKTGKSKIISTTTGAQDNDLLIAMLRKLMERLDEPIEASVALRGKKGLYDILKEDQTLTDNASL